jgi:predicted anti-sigma-YlaC factor YlaD
MTTQDAYTEKISSWLDNELTEAEAVDLQHHLRQCPTCQTVYQEFKQMDEWLHRAALVMVAPAPGFTGRFETRLAHHHPHQRLHLWLAVLGLALGAIFILAATALFGGVAIYSLSASAPAINGQLAHNGLVYLINSANTARFFLGMGWLFLKTSLLTMQTPLFWGLVVVAAASAWLWVRVMRSLLKTGVAATAKLML